MTTEVSDMTRGLTCLHRKVHKIKKSITNIDMTIGVNDRDMSNQKNNTEVTCMVNDGWWWVTGGM